jgi:AcrR family transcriptional regulator
MTHDNDTYQRILDAAAKLFATRGYKGVTLRDIGDALGMKHASLYYYAPDGKPQLYRDVMERSFRRHREGITQAIAGAGDGVRAQLRAVGRWLVSQPPMEMSRVIHADAAGIGSEEAAGLSQLAYEALREPLVAALRAARADDQIALRNLDMGALAFVTLVEVVHAVPGGMSAGQMEVYLDELIDMLMNGWVRRE